MPMGCCPNPVGCDTNVDSNWLFEACGCGCWIEGGSLILGALEGVPPLEGSSATPNEIISTMLDTSFFTRSGSEFGRSFPVNLRLHRYIASANSGKRSCPDLVVSESVLSLLG